MQILNAVTGKNKVRVIGRMQKFVFVLAITADNLAGCLTKMDNSKIILERDNPTLGVTTPIHETNLRDLFEIAARNAGLVQITNVSTAYTVKATVELSDTGSLPKITDEEFTLSYDLDTNVSATVYKLEYDDNARDRFEYLTTKVDGGEAFEVPVADTQLVGIPKSGVTNIEFRFKDKNRIKYTAAELEIITKEEKPTIYEVNGLTSDTSERLFVFNTSRLESIVIEQSSDGKIYKVLPKPI